MRRELAALITLACFLLFIAVAAPSFYRSGNLRDLALANLAPLLVAAGMTLVMAAAQIDVSVGSLFAVCGVSTGLLARAGVPVLLLPVAGALMGSLLGAVNGGLVSYVRAPAIVVTLATMVAWRETLNWATGGAWVESLPSNFQWLGLPQAHGEALLLICAAAAFTALWWASRNVAAFRRIYATGSDPEAARLGGLSPERVVFGAFVLLGALVGVAAALNAARFSDIPANTGTGLELRVIAAVVVGGTAIRGGRGSLMGTLAGVVLLGSIGSALTYLKLSAYWEKAVQGGIILIAVFLDALTSRPARK